DGREAAEGPGVEGRRAVRAVRRPRGDDRHVLRAGRILAARDGERLLGPRRRRSRLLLEHRGDAGEGLRNGCPAYDGPVAGPASPCGADAELSTDVGVAEPARSRGVVVDGF